MGHAKKRKCSKMFVHVRCRRKTREIRRRMRRENGMEYLINAAVIDRSVIHSFRLRWGKKGRVWSSRERATSCADVADRASFALKYLTKKIPRVRSASDRERQRIERNERRKERSTLFFLLNVTQGRRASISLRSF